MVAISILLLPFRPLWSPVLFVGGLCDHVLRPLRVRAEHADDLQGTHHALCDRLAVIRDLWSGLVRLARPGRAR